MKCNKCQREIKCPKCGGSNLRVRFPFDVGVSENSVSMGFDGFSYEIFDVELWCHDCDEPIYEDEALEGAVNFIQDHFFKKEIFDGDWCVTDKGFELVPRYELKIVADQ